MVGSYTNTIHPSDFSNNELVAIPANVTAPLNITTGLTGAKTFTPTSVTSGGTSRVKITVTNSSNGDLTNVSVDDSDFVTGTTGTLQVANPANAATSCAGSPTMVVNPGTTLAQLLGATLNAGSSCDFSFDVVTGGAGPWRNTVGVGKITSAEGPANTASFSAQLTAIAAQININKSFNPVIVTGGVPSTLTLTLTNPSVAVLHGIGFTDVFPIGIEVYSVPAVTSTCTGGTVTAIPGDGKVSLSGATMAANSSCTITLQTTSVKFLNLTNSIPAGAVVSSEGYTNPLLVSATLSTLQGLGVMKAFSPAYVAVNQVTSLKMRLVSTFDPNAPSPMTLTGVSYTDTLPNGVLIAGTPNVSTDCAGTGPGGQALITTSNNGTTNGLVTVSLATIPPDTNCSISVDVVANTLGAYNNIIPADSVTTDQGILNSSAASATLFVVNKPTVSKSFANSTRNPGQANRLTVTITNGSSVTLSGVALTDTLPAGVEIASTPNTGGTCVTTGNGTINANAGGGTLSISGATIAPGASCTFYVDVVSNSPGTYINYIPINSIVTNEGLSNNPGDAQAQFTVNNPPTVSKAFNPVSIDGSGVGVGVGISTLQINLGNPNAGAITLSSALVDAFPATVLAALTPNVGGTCPGAKTVAANRASISYASGASIPSGGCTILVDVVSTTPGTYTNTIAAGQLSTTAGVNQDPAIADLSVGPGSLVPPTMAKSFSPATIPRGGTSALTIILGNPNSSVLVLLDLFTDTLPANVVVAAAPNIRGTCTTGSIAAAAGTGTITYASGATIPSGGCTIIVDVTSSFAGSYTNTLSIGTLITDGSNPVLPATAGLVVNAPIPPTVVKSFSPNTINPGGISRLTISLGNSNGGTISLSSDFTDTLPAGVLIAPTPNKGGTCTNGSITAAAGAGTITYASGAAIPSGGCTIMVDVTAASNSGSPYANTINAAGLNTSAGNNGAPATAKLFVNPPQPPSISKSFSPTSILAGATSTLTISLGNGNATGTTLTADLVDTLPANVVIAATPAIHVIGVCTIGKVVAAAGGGTVTYQSGGALPAGGCSISVAVTSNTKNAGYVNNIAIGALQTGIGNNSAGTSATLTVVAPDLTISKMHSGSFTQGETGATYTVTVTNSGNGDKTAGNTVTVTESAPSGLTVTAMSGTGWTCTVLPTCTRTDALATGSSYPPITVTADVATNAAANLTNSASVALTGQPESATNNNTATDPTAITQLPDLTITKTHSGSFTQGQTGAQYTVTVTNSGSAAVSGTVTVTESAPSGLTVTAMSGDGWTCTVLPTCTRTDALATGNSYPPITVTADVATNAAANLTNSASVALTGQPESATNNNTATDPTAITQLPDLTITKTHSGSFTQGQTGAQYTVTVTNSGSAAVSGTVTVTESAPSGLTVTAMSGDGWTCTVLPTCTRTDALAAGNSYPPITVTVNIADNAAMPLTNTASVSLSAQSESNTNNNTSSDPTTVTMLPDLTITKTHSGSFTQAQIGATYTIAVINSSGSGDKTAGNMVTVTESAPVGLTVTGMSGPGWNCAVLPICTRTDVLVAGGSYPPITVAVNVAANAAANLTNSASVSLTGEPESITSNNTVTDPTAIDLLPDLTMAKTHTGNFWQGQTGVQYTVTVTNSGSAAVSGTVTVTESAPSGLTVTAMSGTGWNCTVLPTCTRTSALGVGSNYPPITVTANVAGNAATPLINSVSVSLTGQSESVTNNNTATDLTTIASPNLYDPPNVIKRVDGSNLPILRYTAIIINGGDGPALEAVFADNIPSHTTYVPGTITINGSQVSDAYPDADGGYDAADKRIVINMGTVMPGASVTMTFDVRVEIGFAGSISNQASVSGSNFPTELTDDPSTAAAKDPTVLQVNAVVSIPAMSEWGMLIFLVIAGLGSFYYLRGRRCVQGSK